MSSFARENGCAPATGASPRKYGFGTEPAGGTAPPAILRYSRVSSESTLATVPWRPAVPATRSGTPLASTMKRMRSCAASRANQRAMGASMARTYWSRATSSVTGIARRRTLPSGSPRNAA